MKRAAIYARFSSDLQRDRSIEDQVALCRETCVREGFRVVGTFEDHGLSGSSAVNRPGLLALEAAAKARHFDVLVIEDIDRLSRDQADYHRLRKQFDFLGIEIVTASGTVSRIDGSLRALMSELYLENLAGHVRRGLRGVLRDGRHPGGRAFGYRAVSGRPGELEIIEAEAEIVREIFRRYAAGETPRTIAIDLNARAIRPSRARYWNASTINGNYARKSGMLFNELYIGRIIWNRQRMPKDPTTGKRVARPNGAKEHVIIEAPHLRIIDDETWQRVCARKAQRHHEMPSAARRPVRVLSGLIRCGTCGGGMSAVARDRTGMRLQCSSHRESGTCENKRMVYRDHVERMVLDGLRDLLKDRAGMDRFLRVYAEERARLRKETLGDLARLERRTSEIEREIARGVEAIIKGGVDAVTLAPRLKELENEKAEIMAQVGPAKAETEQIVTLHPVSIDRHRQSLDAMAALLDRDDHGSVAGDLIIEVRKLVSRVVIHAPADRTPVRIEVIGKLADLLAGAAYPDRSSGGGSVVAGVGFEPTTFRL